VLCRLHTESMLSDICFNPADLAPPLAADPPEKSMTLSVCFWVAEALYYPAKMHF